MFEISELKAKTLADLQQIAKSIGLTKTSQLKKLDLVYQILDIQATTPIKTEKKSENSKPKANKPKRKRVVKKVIAEESISKDVTKPTLEVSEKKSNLDLNVSGDKQNKKPVHKTDGVEKNAATDKNTSNEDKLVQNPHYVCLQRMYHRRPTERLMGLSIYTKFTYKFREINCIISSTAVIDLELTS